MEDHEKNCTKFDEAFIKKMEQWEKKKGLGNVPNAQKVSPRHLMSDDHMCDGIL